MRASQDFDKFHGDTPEELKAWLNESLCHQYQHLLRTFRGPKRNIALEV